MTKRDKLLQEFLATLFRVRRVVDNSFPVSPGDTAMTVLRMQTLKYLREHPGATVGQLARELRMSSPSVTQFVDRLVRANLVTRAPDARDRRMSRLALSRKGRDAMQEFPAIVRRKMHQVFSRIPEKDLKEVIRIFRDVLEAIRDEKEFRT